MASNGCGQESPEPDAASELRKLRAEFKAKEAEVLKNMAPEGKIPVDSSAGHALYKVLGILNSKLALVSSPERCGGPGVPAGEYPVPCMTGLERAAAICPEIITAYDFAGSAAASDCLAHMPDNELEKEHWRDPHHISSTQWCRYWMGRVRACLTSLLLTHPGLACQLSVDGARVGVGNLTCANGAKYVMPVSISGGIITQTEFSHLPGLINGTLADLSSRESDIGTARAYWIHFDCLDDFLKALQGYGGICLKEAFNDMKFNRPGRWRDGPYNAKYDMLRNVPGDTPEERRAYLSKDRMPTQKALNKRLVLAIAANDPYRAKDLLAARANPDTRFDGGMSGMPAILSAAERSNPEMVRLLLEAKASPHPKTKSGMTALAFLKKESAGFGRDEAGKVQAQIDATVELLSAAERAYEPGTTITIPPRTCVAISTNNIRDGPENSTANVVRQMVLGESFTVTETSLNKEGEMRVKLFDGGWVHLNQLLELPKVYKAKSGNWIRDGMDNSKADKVRQMNVGEVFTVTKIGVNSDGELRGKIFENGWVHLDQLIEL